MTDTASTSSIQNSSIDDGTAFFQGLNSREASGSFTLTDAERRQLYSYFTEGKDGTWDEVREIESQLTSDFQAGQGFHQDTIYRATTAVQSIQRMAESAYFIALDRRDAASRATTTTPSRLSTWFLPRTVRKSRITAAESQRKNAEAELTRSQYTRLVANAMDISSVALSLPPGTRGVSRKTADIMKSHQSLISTVTESLDYLSGRWAEDGARSARSGSSVTGFSKTAWTAMTDFLTRSRR